MNVVKMLKTFYTISSCTEKNSANSNLLLFSEGCASVDCFVQAKPAVIEAPQAEA
jgi:hypothetical protein